MYTSETVLEPIVYWIESPTLYIGKSPISIVGTSGYEI